MASLAERVATLVLNKFESLPKKCKPRTYPDGRREWTPLSSVVLAHGWYALLKAGAWMPNGGAIGDSQDLICVSLA